MRILPFVFAAFSVAPATAQEVDPQAVEAIAIAGEGWDLAYELASDADPIATDVLTWMRLREGAGTFRDYQRFLAERPDWPGLDRLRA